MVQTFVPLMFDSRIEETRSLIALLRSTNPDVQHTSLKELMFSSTPSVVGAFLEDGNLKVLMELCSSPHRRVESSALRLLWHLSAQAEMKVVMYEEGILTKIKNIMLKDDPEDQLACSAILQNISEYRFCRGGMNPNQVKLVNDGILSMLSARIKADDKRVQFLTCLSICNLSMTEENHKKVEKSGLLSHVQQFVHDNQLHVDMVCHWLTLQPHIPLLQSKYYEVKLFALSCLLTLVRNDHYKMEVWRTLSMNDGVKTLFNLAKSPDHSISQLASLIISTLQLEEPMVATTPCDVGGYLSKMFNNPEFSDVKFICQDEILYGHKAILAARCPLFHAMFTRFRESKQDEIRIPEETMDYETLKVVVEFVYTGSAKGITRKNAVDILAAAEMYELPELKTHCEAFLWHFIDSENAVTLYRTSVLYRAPQLLRACSGFLGRNFERVSKTEAYNELPQDGKDEIINMAKEKDKQANLKAGVDSQGKRTEEEEKRKEVEEAEADYMDEERVAVA